MAFITGSPTFLVLAQTPAAQGLDRFIGSKEGPDAHVEALLAATFDGPHLTHRASTLDATGPNFVTTRLHFVATDPSFGATGSNAAPHSLRAGAPDAALAHAERLAYGAFITTGRLEALGPPDLTVGGICTTAALYPRGEVRPTATVAVNALNSTL